MISRQAARKLVGTLAAAAALVAAGLFNRGLWQEYFGAGPPYYAGTTNMDKWTNPWPKFAVVNLVALAILIVGVRSARRR